MIKIKCNRDLAHAAYLYILILVYLVSSLSLVSYFWYLFLVPDICSAFRFGVKCVFTCSVSDIWCLQCGQMFAVLLVFAVSLVPTVSLDVHNL